MFLAPPRFCLQPNGAPVTSLFKKSFSDEGKFPAL